jgi:hypothetical protein
MDFGQIVPLILLIILVFAAAEVFYGERVGPKHKMHADYGQRRMKRKRRSNNLHQFPLRSKYPLQ